MSERLRTTNGEHLERLTAPSPEHHKTRAETSVEREPKKHEKEPHKLAAEARQEISKAPEAKVSPLDRLKASEAGGQAAQPLNVNQELKAITVQRELTHIRRKLSAPQRTLSRIIHQPAMRVVSEVTGKTVSRPSGLLGGSLVAFLGTTSYLFFAKHYGYEYNYLIFLLLFAGGFILGLILELIVHWGTAAHRHSHD